MNKFQLYTILIAVLSSNCTHKNQKINDSLQGLIVYDVSNVDKFLSKDISQELFSYIQNPPKLPTNITWDCVSTFPTYTYYQDCCFDKNDSKFCGIYSRYKVDTLERVIQWNYVSSGNFGNYKFEYNTKNQLKRIEYNNDVFIITYDNDNLIKLIRKV